MERRHLAGISENEMTNRNEVWQVEVNKQIFEANVEELCQWIAESALLPKDKVRRGNLRWIEADKVPLLHQFFNAKELGIPYPVLQTLTDASLTDNESQIKTENFATPQIIEDNFAKEFKNSPLENQTTVSSPVINRSPTNCILHTEEAAKYVCENCATFFCKSCPKSYGSSVKICPLCDAMCRPIADAQAEQKRNLQNQHAAAEGFGFSDFGRALAYPFRFKTSLIFGALMFMFFTLGQSAGAIGGMITLAASIFSAMLANALTFGCLANTIENFSQGNVEANFMPGFDDFELWDDVIHPFFLSIGAYLVSFAPLVIIIVASVFYFVSSIKSPDSSLQNVPTQVEQKNVIVEQMNRQAAERNQQIGDAINGNQANAESKEDEIKRLEKMINESRKSELESAVGKTPETVQKENEQLIKQFLGKGTFVLVLTFLALLWGAFYFPAACCVAGYTRSFTAVLNPLVGLDTIKRLGFNYAKVLAMCFVLAVFSIGASLILETIFAPFDLPRMGNLPAKAVAGLFTFYFSIVFSVTLGYALYKSADRLNLYRG